MMMKVNIFNTIAILLLSPWQTSGQTLRSSPTYRVRSVVDKRDLQLTQFNPVDMLLSFSDDGAEREDEFYLDIFDTPEILTNSDSPVVISDAMNNFLIQELNGKFDELNVVEKVASEIVNLNTRNGTYVNSSGVEVGRIGTEARMKVTLSFEQTPSPKTGEVQDTLKDVMSNLTYFVTNLTSSVSADNELSGVYEAIRREIRPPVFVQPPSDTTIIVDISEPTGQTTGGNQNNISTVTLTTVPIVVGVAVLAAVIVFFVFRKRKKPDEPQSPKDSALYDVENEIFSIDRSVESVDTSKSPISRLEPMSQEDSSVQYSASTDSEELAVKPGGDSVFSGIDTEYGSVLSPKSLSSPKSMMTGFTCASASTIQASNLNKNKNKKKSSTKSPAGGNSIFAFLDPIEDADEEDLDELELIERSQPAVNSSTSQDTNENAYSGNDRESGDGSESASSSSLEGVSINLPVKSKEEEQANETTTAPTADPVSHVLADLENMETTIGSAPRDPTPSNVFSKVHTKNQMDPTPRNGEQLNSLSDEKKEDNIGMSAINVATMASTLMGGFFKGKRNSASTPNSPTSSPTNGGASSAPSSPMQQVGRHWLTSPDKKHLKIPVSPKLDTSVDYDKMLGHPSPSPEEHNESKEFNDSINESMRIVDRAPQDPPEYYPPGGRRHVGDKIGGDGSALYQASAMKPTDWSCKSSDAGSVGSSTIGEEENQKQNNSDSSSTNIATESKKSVSASRQLINDLVWLEKKIATVRGETKLSRSTPPAIETDDSSSYDSNNNHDEIEGESSHDSSSPSDKDASNIVCRDCFAPPGKLHIVIHSTKDGGPAVHTVKQGSSLEGEIFPGDLIISVDNIDTRTCSAEEVMKMMASKGDQQRKITILRFLEEV